MSCYLCSIPAPISTTSASRSMYQSKASWSSPGHGDSAAAVQITKQRLEKQLVAVIELSECNATYLEPFEIAWINSIIDNAVASVFDTIDSDLHLIQPERSSRSQSWLQQKLSARRLRLKLTQSSPRQPPDELDLLLNNAKALNSAINLLSCCYDRWCWSKSSNAGNKEMDAGQAASELRDFLDWTRQTNHPGANRSSLASRHSLQPFTPNNYSVTTPFQTPNETPGTWLTLLADGTVEKWRQNAEDALAATNARLQGESLGETQPYSHRSLDNGINVSHSLPSCAVERGHVQPISPQESKGVLSNECKRPCGHRAAEAIVTVTPQHNGFSSPSSHCCACTLQHNLDRSSVASLFQSNGAAESILLSPAPPLRAQPSLQNSYEKEPLISNATSVQYLRPQQHALIETISGGRTLHIRSQSDIVSGPSSPTSRTTATREDSTRGISSESITSGSIISSPSVNQSTVSFQSKVSEGRTAQRSRGRMWLEQQAESEGR